MLSDMEERNWKSSIRQAYAVDRVKGNGNSTKLTIAGQTEYGFDYGICDGRDKVRHKI